MMLQPLARKGGGALPPVALDYTTPAPVGGWNARDSIADMPITDAPIIKNWFPGTSRIRVRRGFEEFLTSLASDVETLMVYASGTKDEMFAAADGKIFAATSAGSVGAALVTAMSDNRWQYKNMGTPGGNFLIAVNGTDAPRKYDGTNWGATSITGATQTTFIDVNVFKRRLFFVIKNSLKFAYLNVESIAGTAAEFDLAPLCKLGGYLMAMGTWTRDGGDGLDDFAVFITSKGEAIVYQGDDPGDANAWAQVGSFKLGAPIGRRCMEQVGADLVVITQDGFVPFSTALGNGRATPRLAISDKIRNAVNDATRSYGSNFGWQAILYPRGSMLLVNVPLIENGETEQYVANTATGAWCQFTGQNANCWAVFNEELYFGGSDGVYKADTGTSDNGMDIDADVQQASTRLRGGGQKIFRFLRPNLTTDGAIRPAITVNVDHEIRSPIDVPGFTPPSGSLWDTSPWNTSAWNTGPTVTKDWICVEGIGRYGAVRMRLLLNGGEVYWNSTEWIYESGGLM